MLAYYEFSGSAILIIQEHKVHLLTHNITHGPSVLVLGCIVHTHLDFVHNVSIIQQSAYGFKFSIQVFYRTTQFQCVI